jgi:hypothetical protein
VIGVALLQQLGDDDSGDIRIQLQYVVSFPGGSRFGAESHAAEADDLPTPSPLTA